MESMLPVGKKPFICPVIWLLSPPPSPSLYLSYSIPPFPTICNSLPLLMPCLLIGISFQHQNTLYFSWFCSHATSSEAYLDNGTVNLTAVFFCVCTVLKCTSIITLSVMLPYSSLWCPSHSTRLQMPSNRSSGGTQLSTPSTTQNASNTPGRP